MKVISFLFVISLFVAGCKHLEQLELKEYPVTPVSADNYQALNGTYSNVSDTAIGTSYNNHYNTSAKPVAKTNLIQSLVTFLPQQPVERDSNGIIKKEKEWVNIEFVSAKKAILSYYRNEEFLCSKSIKGTFKNGYFYRRPRWYFIPFIPLFFGYKNELIRIGKSGDQLIVDHYDNSFIFLLVGGGWNKERSKSVYPSKKNN